MLYRRFGTICLAHLQGSRSIVLLGPWKWNLWGRPETSVQYYHSTLHNMPLSINAIVSEETHILYKNTNHQQMHKQSFIINRNTLLHASTLLSHLQGELSFTLTLGLHFTVEWECAVDCVHSRVETCSSVLRLMIKLSLWICWWLVFLYHIVHGYGTH
jgi:hypothetical protein